MFTRKYVAAALVGLSILLSAATSSAQTPPMQPPPRTISVSGEGIARVAPDQAVVRFAVVTQAMDPEAARAQNAEASRNVLNTVRDLGIPERNIRMETLQLQPAREYDPDTQRWRENGFEVTRIVTVDLDDLDALPTLVARVVQEGANRLDGVSYELKNRDEARNQALRAALVNAREKATFMVETLDQSLGEVLTISEQSFDFPHPVMRFDQAMMKEAMPEPEAYAPGEIEVRAVVNVVFGLR